MIVYNGYYKLVEELGELLVELSAGPINQLTTENEIADTLASISYFAEKNGFKNLSEEITTLKQVHLNVEIGKLVQLLGKLGPFPFEEHPDGSGKIFIRLERQLTIVDAMLKRLITQRAMDSERIEKRFNIKKRKFVSWGLNGIILGR